MYFRPPNESPWSPPGGAVLNPWLAPSSGGATDGASSTTPMGTRGVSTAYWSDAPFPKEGSTYESLLNELVDNLFRELYEVIDKEDIEQPPVVGEPAPPPAAPLEESSAASRSKVTGIFEAPQLPPHPTQNAPACNTAAIFPSPAEYQTCGKLALLYPLRASWITRSVNRKLDEADWRSVKTCAILINWLKEMYSDELNESEPGAPIDASATRSCVCNYCQRSFKPFSFRVRCAECSDYDLCERCFSEGREADNHLKTHRYIPIGPQNLPLFKEQWSASEELVLLEAVGKYGFGNWNEVSEWVSIVSPGTTIPKDKEACKKQYFDFHLMNRKTHSVPTWPIQNVKSRLLYDGSLGFTQALHQFCQNDASAKGGGLLAHVDNLESVVDYTPIYDDAGIDLLITRKPNTTNNNNQSAYEEPEWPEEFADDTVWERPNPTAPIYYQAAKPSGTLPPRVSIVGYLPNRGESDNEWENNYELNICDLEIKEYEPPMEKELKLRALEAYNTVLDQRALRKRLYLDKYILNSPSTPVASGGATLSGSTASLDFKTKWLSKNNSSEVREVYSALRQLWRYVYTNRTDFPPALFTKVQKHHECFADVLPSDLEEIPELIADDAQLIDRLDLLTAWKEEGLSTLEDVVEKGSAISQAIDSRESVPWSLKYYVDPKATCAGGGRSLDLAAGLPEIKSEGSSTRGRAATHTDTADVSCIRAPLSPLDRLRVSLGLGEVAFESLKHSIQKQLHQLADNAQYRTHTGEAALVDLAIDAQNVGEATSNVVAASSPNDDGGKSVQPSTVHEARAEVYPPPQQSNMLTSAGNSANAVLSFAQRQVINQQPSGSTPPVRTIPKKRRMLNVEEEGEIPGG